MTCAILRSGFQRNKLNDVCKSEKMWTIKQGTFLFSSRNIKQETSIRTTNLNVTGCQLHTVNYMYLHHDRKIVRRAARILSFHSLLSRFHVSINTDISGRLWSAFVATETVSARYGDVGINYAVDSQNNLFLRVRCIIYELSELSYSIHYLGVYSQLVADLSGIESNVPLTSLRQPSFK